ncbi:MAG TPA: hypothetical protein VEO01_34400 [Pseudonocardiaceae bacterium]|nr:hypothetical protein [Pseudonocardiaceae bacterium]
MSSNEDPKYAVVDCTVVGHQAYGLVVQDDHGRRGFVDSLDIDDEIVAEHRWPPIGEPIRCVLLGHTRDGRLRLSLRPSDVALVTAVDNAAAALAEWARIRDLENPGVELRQSFYRSGRAADILRWALRRLPNSVDSMRAHQLLLDAPESLRIDVLGDE